MASLICLSLLFFSISFAYSTDNSPTIEIQQACKSTRYPEQCQSQLPSNLSHPQPFQIIQAALSVSYQNLKTTTSMVQNILSTSSDNRNRSRVAQTCLEVLDSSDHRTQSAIDALSRFKIKDARAFLSAVLSYEYGCWSGLKTVNDTQNAIDTMSFVNETLLVSTSNVLSMMASYDVFGNQTEFWAPPKTERDGFWEGSGESGSLRGLGFVGGFPSRMASNATVCKGGKEKGCHETVQAAVDAAPSGLEGKKFVIRIQEGVYEETVKIGLDKKNLMFLGDGIGKTVITGSLNTGLLGINTYYTATVGVLGDGFMAKDLTFQNTAGPGAQQAVAFRSESDLSYLENVEFLGNQDTLYALALRQLYKSCQIEGNVDFIFGNAAAIFQNCTILIRPRQDKPEAGETNAIAAHGRTDPAQSTGFAFLNCFIGGTDDYMKFHNANPKVHLDYLGRPWKEFSRIVYIDCTLEGLIEPDGWLPWSGDFALKTLYFGEYENKGPGADLSKRVPWSSQIPSEHINTYSAYNFIQAEVFNTFLSSFRKRIGTIRRIPHIILY